MHLLVNELIPLLTAGKYVYIYAIFEILKMFFLCSILSSVMWRHVLLYKFIDTSEECAVSLVTECTWRLRQQVPPRLQYMSARMQYVIFRREYSLVAVVTQITLVRLDEPVARACGVAHQIASHMSLCGEPEYFQNENERHFKSGQHEVVIHQRCSVDSTDSNFF